MNANEAYTELKETLCNQDDALKSLIFTINKNQKKIRSKPQNILLLGEYGVGKTTMVEQIAEQMDIPMAIVYSLMTDDGIDVNSFFNSVQSLMSQNEDESLNGILLIHDMEKCFLYGAFDQVSSLLSMRNMILKNGNKFDFSGVTFVGEVNTNSFNDVFPKKIDNLEELESQNYSTYVNDQTEFVIEDNNNLTPEQEELIIRKIARKEYLSLAAHKLFNKRIFMKNLKIEEIAKVINSPISQLQSYRDDLDDEYLNSDEFKLAVASQIIESDIGLNFLSEAIETTAFNDNKRNVKVFKPNSFMKQLAKK